MVNGIVEIINRITVDQWLSLVNIVMAMIIAIVTYNIANRLSAKDKYQHEINISNRLLKIGFGRKVILADVKKYNPKNKDATNKSYYKQACAIHSIIQVFGVVISLRGRDGEIFGLIPFDWIEYVRPNDSEDSCSIIVCKFKGIKWYKKFKSPIKEIIKE